MVAIEKLGSTCGKVDNFFSQHYQIRLYRGLLQLCQLPEHIIRKR